MKLHVGHDDHHMTEAPLLGIAWCIEHQCFFFPKSARKK